MQTFFTDLLARERIAEFRREAERDRLVAKVRAARRARRHRGATPRTQVLVEHRPERAAA